MTTPTVCQAMSAVMEEVRSVGKNDRNSSQGFKFRGIDAVVNACGPALRNHGVVVVPIVLEHTYGTVTTGRNNTVMGHALVKVEYRFHGPAGDHISAIVMGEAFDSGDKATTKAMSVAFRTALLQALALPTDDADPDASSYERSAPEPEHPKPVATDKQVAKWTAAITAAPDWARLKSVGDEISGYALADDVRAELVAIFAARKDEIGA